MDSKVKPPSSNDVAKLAGVSRTAVSRTFSNNGYVSTKTREKVHKAAKSLGYRVNYLAKGLTHLRSNLVGLVMADIDSPYRSQQIKSLSEKLLDNDFHPILVPTSSDRDSSSVIELLMRYNVGGVIITSDTPPDSIYYECVAHQIPVVLINKAEQNYKSDRVECNNQQGIEFIAETLTKLGCSQVAVISTHSNSYSISERTHRFLTYAKKIGLKTNTIYVDHHTYEMGNIAGNLLLETGTLPNGIFCTNDLLAIGVQDSLKQSLTSDELDAIPIIGFDDIPQANWSGNNISTVRQSTEIMARYVTDMLKKRQENPDIPPQSTMFDVELVLRGSLADKP
ncbi:LacI family transcriptional regulator [Photobacterium makurazakiensis]|uniref:LacI family DNA-binding transcriptional regulator n=1 Tax=Photobacterium makurazakiensis TaxID=2910234 RepID=UPI003D11C4B4